MRPILLYNIEQVDFPQKRRSHKAKKIKYNTRIRKGR